MTNIIAIILIFALDLGESHSAYSMVLSSVFKFLLINQRLYAKSSEFPRSFNPWIIFSSIIFILPCVLNNSLKCLLLSLTFLFLEGEWTIVLSTESLVPRIYYLFKKTLLHKLMVIKWEFWLL